MYPTWRHGKEQGGKKITKAAYLQPIHRAPNIPQPQQQPITREQVDEGALELPAALVAAVDRLERRGPELERRGGYGVREAQAADHAAPDVVDDEVGGRGGAPAVQEGHQLGLGVPGAVGARFGGLVVHGRAQGDDSEYLRST